MKHGRDHGRGRDAVALDQFEERFRLEFIPDDRGRAEKTVHREKAECRGVIERARDKVHVVHAHRRLGDKAKYWLKRIPGESSHSSFRLAGGARRVHDDRRILVDAFLDVEPRCRVGEEIFFVADAAGNVASHRDQPLRLEPRKVLGRLFDRRPQVRLEDDGLGPAIRCQIRKLGSGRSP